MPRILRIMNRFNLGGPTYNAAYLTRYLPGDFETLLVGGKNEPSERDSLFILHQLGIQAQMIENMQRAISPLKDWKAYQEIREVISRFQPHIVHTHASKAGALGRYAALQMGVPVIVHTFHGHIFDAYFNATQAAIYKSIERYLARHSHGIIAISQAQKDDLADKYRICPADKIRVIPLGFDLSRFRINQQQNRELFRKQYQLEEDEMAIGIVGRVVPIKNHLMFLKAIQALAAQSGVKIRAFIIGDGEIRQQVQQQATHLGMDHVWWPRQQRKALLTFTGWLTSMDQVTAGLDIVALTSLSEGTPVNLIEAQAAGKPIVSTRVGGVENIVAEDQTAFLVARNDYQAMAGKLQQLAEDHYLRERFSARGWHQVKEKFHYSRLVNDMEGYYRQLLSDRNMKC